MKRFFFCSAIAAFAFKLSAQTVAANLATAYAAFEKDSQMRSGIASLYVIDAAIGAVVFDKNSGIGLAPASTQKIITAAAAYELLGQRFQYKTTFAYSGVPVNGRLAGSVFVFPSGDPTLGSWRWKTTSEDSVLKRITDAFTKAGIRSLRSFLVEERIWQGETIPGGWIWDDVGNYYGAGAAALNWHENQYDLYLKSGKNLGDAVTIAGTKPKLYGYNLASKATAAAKGSGDNAYIYFPVNSSSAVVRGTIPVGEERFAISGALPSGRKQFLATLTDSLLRRDITKDAADTVLDESSKGRTDDYLVFFHTETSPPLDSICYWFLKRSINLYGEALAKTIAVQGGKPASTEDGTNIIENFWSKKGLGIDKTELNLHDGSGLSPLNRVTTHAQVSVLQYAAKQPWFSSYVNCFPEFNGMKLKSGTISGAKSFCGYHTSKSGKSYIVSFIVNNYNGPSSALVQKMYKVLDELK